MKDTDVHSQSASEIIAARLAAAGCKHAFGIPGGEVLALMDALDRAGLNITLVKHENSGGFMAEGTWHASLAAGVRPGLRGHSRRVPQCMLWAAMYYFSLVSS